MVLLVLYCMCCGMEGLLYGGAFAHYPKAVLVSRVLKTNHNKTNKQTNKLSNMFNSLSSVLI